jgi:NAD(P)-dependent dehydrogenase (short-subunit alcohol dehydrogenase family)
VPTKTQRIAVITGGGSGIGAAVAQALAEDGWTVVLAGRRKEALEAVVAGSAGLAGVLDAIPTDVTDEASVRRLFERVSELLRSILMPLNSKSGTRCLPST